MRPDGQDFIFTGDTFNQVNIPSLWWLVVAYAILYFDAIAMMLRRRRLASRGFAVDEKREMKTDGNTGVGSR